MKMPQENSYSSFGGLFGEGTSNTNQAYKYNGKELDRMHGLDWYDYGARNYDAQLARLQTVDPLSEDYYFLSPYGYCAGNPIACRDENGEWINFVVGAIVGAATDYAVQVIANVVENGGEITMDAFTNVDRKSIAISAVAGGVSSNATSKTTGAIVNTQKD